MPNTQNTPAEEKSAPARRARKPRKSAAAVEQEPSAAVQESPAPAPKKEKKPARSPRAPRQKKEEKPAETPAAASPAPAEPTAPAPKPAPAPKAPQKPARPAAAAPEAPAAPEPAPGFSAPETVGGHEPQGNGGHRKRRRRNRRGGDSSQSAAPTHAVQVDPDELKRRAWKIYLGEVTEEGLALMDDRIASEAARRSFRVAELFLIEAAHHAPAPEKETPDSNTPA